MIDALLAAEDRETPVVATRALDRILMWNYYVIPLYHRSGFPTALWNTVGRCRAGVWRGAGNFLEYGGKGVALD